METTFLTNFSNNTKVWVYQSPRALTAAEQEWIAAEGAAFIAGWNAHGTPMKGSVNILHDRFIVVASDQDAAMNSGCSIDSMVRFVRMVQDRTGLDLMNRMLVYVESNGELLPCNFQEIGKLYSEGTITDNTLVYNPLVDSKPAFEQNWKKPIKESWLARFVS